MDWGGLDLVHGTPVSVDEHGHSALCLNSFAETVWPAEPEGFTANLLKHLQPLISTKKGDTGLCVCETLFHPIERLL